MQFNNPVFQEDDSVSNENQCSTNSDEETETDCLAEMLATQDKLEKLMVHTKESELDLKTLNNKRISPNELLGSNLFDQSLLSSTPNDYIKIGSLKGSLKGSKEEILKKLHIIVNQPDILPGEKEPANRALVEYFAFLGNPECTDDVDFEFLDAIFVTADINITDDYGQTLMHEVAREWNTDFAYFLQLKGIKIDAEDGWGRTPLFVAVASNNTAMVQWLIENGADINHRTIKGEAQGPIHFAARFDAVESFNILVASGANPLDRDQYNRTPFFIAAEIGNSRICGHFLDLELPVACYATTGVSTIDQIIENLPLELANRALDQFIGGDMNKNNLSIYLSCLGKRRWRLLAKNPSNSASASLTRVTPPDTFEIITRKADLDLITHPVIKLFLKLKSQIFAERYIHFNVAFQLFFTILWTICVSYRVADIETGSTATKGEKIAILIMTLISQVLTFGFIYKLYLQWKLEREFVRQQKSRLAMECENSKSFCHPRWQSDNDMLTKKWEAVKLMGTRFWSDGWTFVELLCLLLASVYTVITIAWYITEEVSTLIQRVRIYYSAFFVLVLWLRLNRCFKSHQSFGPFIAMVGQCVIALAQIGFLFFEFFIPFSVTIWVLFGGGIVTDDHEYVEFNNVLYQAWLMANIGDYDISTLKVIDLRSTQIIVGMYFLLVSIITINIYIALLSEAFARVIASASAMSYLGEAVYISTIEKMMPEHKRKFETYLNRYCAPLILDRRDFESGDSKKGNTRSVLSQTARTVVSLNRLLPKLVENELSVKKDLSSLEEKLRLFRKKHSRNKTRDTMQRFASWMDFQAQPLSKMAKSTEKFVNFLRRK